MTITIHMTVDGAAEAMAFYKRAFGAKEVGARIVEADGKIGHATMEFNGSTVYLNDEYPDIGAVSPKTLGGSSVNFNMAVADVDAVYAQAVEAGATGLKPPEDQFYGERSGTVEDPYGHRWSLQTKLEDVSEEEMARRLEGAFNVERAADAIDPDG